MCNFFVILFFVMVFFFRGGLFTNILLVLIVSITCEQTKEIKNSSTIQEISAITTITTNHNCSSIENLSTLESNTNDDNHANRDNHTWPHQLINNNSTNIDYSPIHNTSIDKTTIKTKTTFNSIDMHNSTSIQNNDHIEINSENELKPIELPTPIRSELNLDNDFIEPITERNGKKSNHLRTALRVAARQGLEAMVELYEKKEPHLLRKGMQHCKIKTFVKFLSISN